MDQRTLRERYLAEIHELYDAVDDIDHDNQMPAALARRMYAAPPETSATAHPEPAAAVALA